MKKALTWLEGNTIPFTFHDYKKQGLNGDVLRQAINEHGWNTVINRRGTTWRVLPDSIKENMDDEGAVAVAKENPSIIKRPLLVYNGTTHLGYKDEKYQEIFK
jgi:Spx/MgsR family transcriptional regulator